MGLIDTHCHLDMVENLDNALNSAKEAGVDKIIAVGEDFQSNQKIIELAKKSSLIKIYPALGLHPGKVNIEDFEKTIAQIKENASDLIAIGESGLDFWIHSTRKNPEQKELQIKSYKAQIELANHFDLPLSAHSRGAWNEAFEIARNENLKKCIFHWYTGGIDLLKKIIAAGFYISASPALEYSQHLIEAISFAPLDKILIETDSPVTFKPESGIYKSQPKDRTRTLNALALIKEKTPAEIANICNKNASNLFKLK